MIRTTALAALFLPGAVLAQTLPLPTTAALETEETIGADTMNLPTGPFAQGEFPSETISGVRSRQVWHVTGGATTQQILAPVAQVLTDAGFTILFNCDTDACGGFDFRFALPVVRPPQMQVNLADFRYLSARKQGGTDGPQAVTILVSHAGELSYVQIDRIGAAGPDTAVVATTAVTPTTATALQPGGLAQAIERDGRVILPGLTFETGSSQLAAGDDAALRELADYLAANPTRTIALVGHTDAEGSLQGNIALSKRRAGAVLERLVTNYGANRRQLQAEGMGYLAPVASNLTAQGRDANRRVEAIITTTSD
jgi:OOP family OmpA-OmpF porin